MIDIAEIFGSKALDEDKLLARGFDGDGEEYLLASVRNATAPLSAGCTSPWRRS